MNERIKELMKQAMVREAYYPAGNDGHPEYRSYMSEEKFAELIVGECIDNLAWHGHDEAVSQLEWFKLNKLGIK